MRCQLAFVGARDPMDAVIAAAFFRRQGVGVSVPMNGKFAARMKRAREESDDVRIVDPGGTVRARGGL